MQSVSIHTNLSQSIVEYSKKARNGPIKIYENSSNTL